MTAISILAMPYFVLLPILARDVLGAGPRGFGLLMGASGLGAFLGGITLARRLQRRPPMPSFLWGQALFLLGLVGLGLCTYYYLALVFIFVSGFGMVTQLSTGNSLLQLNVPNELHGQHHEPLRPHSHGLRPGGQHDLWGGGSLYQPRAGHLPAAACWRRWYAGVVLLRHPELRHFAFNELEEAPGRRGPAAHHFPALINPGHFPIEPQQWQGAH